MGYPLCSDYGGIWGQGRNKKVMKSSVYFLNLKISVFISTESKVYVACIIALSFAGSCASYTTPRMTSPRGTESGDGGGDTL